MDREGERERERGCISLRRLKQLLEKIRGCTG